MDRPLALVLAGADELRSRAAGLLRETGFEGLEAGSAREALEVLRTRPVALLLADLDAPGLGPIDFIERAARLCPSIVSVVLSEREAGEATVEWVRRGAFDVLEKPLDPTSVRSLAFRALNQRRILEELASLRERVRMRSGYRSIVGRSAPMERLRERVEQHAAADAPVLIVGEQGTGKELVARAVHDMSARASRPLLTVDAAARPVDSLERDVFGYERGVLPGGGRRGTGSLERADGGTLLVENIPELPPNLQERLVTCLREGQMTRVGGLEPIPVSVRLMATSRADPEQAVERGLLSEELYHRLAGATVRVPPLRDRIEDVGLLARHFVLTVCEINELPPYRLSPDVLPLLEGYGWPGNVRELRNAVEQAVILAADRTIRPRDLPEVLRRAHAGFEAAPPPPSSRQFRDAKRTVVNSFERVYLQDLLERHRGNVTAAADDAGMLRSALQRLLRKHALRSVDFRPRPRGTRGEDRG